MSVATRFNTLLSTIELSDDQKAKGVERREAVVKVLNRHYWNQSSGTANSVYVGSWGKLTRVRPPRDVDVLFNMPKSVYDRFESRSGNKQSQLLQEVKSVIASSYSTTDIKGGGPVVMVPFSAYNVELIPAFALNGGGHWVCMTDNGGRYKKADYEAELNAVAKSNMDSNGNTRDLVRIMKAWQGYCSVPIKSFHVELVAIDFIKQWDYKGKSAVYYDWMARDFLAYLVGRSGSSVLAPGTHEIMNLGSTWKFKAEMALGRAKKACEYEAAKNWAAAGDEWQKIFGTDIPKYV